VDFFSFFHNGRFPVTPFPSRVERTCRKLVYWQLFIHTLQLELKVLVPHNGELIFKQHTIFFINK